MALKVYYNILNDFKNKNRFLDSIEGNSNVIEYNSFLSTSSVDLYYKVNDRLQTINFHMPDIIPLAIYGIDLKPSSYNKKIETSNGVVIEYNSTNNTRTITNL